MNCSTHPLSLSTFVHPEGVGMGPDTVEGLLVPEEGVAMIITGLAGHTALLTVLQKGSVKVALDVGEAHLEDILEPWGKVFGEATVVPTLKYIHT